MPGEGTRPKVNAPPKPVAAATLFTGAADAAVRLRAPAAAVTASPAVAQATARRRRCVVKCMKCSPVSMAAPRRRGQCRAGVRSAGPAGFSVAQIIFILEPAGGAAAYLL